MLDTGARARLLGLGPARDLGRWAVLVKLSVMEQRDQAVLAVVQDGSKVTEVAARLGFSRKSVHAWLARYEQGGLAALAERSRRPATCPDQIPAGDRGGSATSSRGHGSDLGRFALLWRLRLQVLPERHRVVVFDVASAEQEDYRAV
jgi:hypothetical protein